MVRFGRKSVTARTPGELDAMEAAGRVVGEALVAVRDAAADGVSTFELDQVAEETIRAAGATPAFLGYQGFPASICSSVGSEVVHGIPSRSVILRDGDLVSVDCGAVLDGWFGDSAWTFGVGELTAEIETFNRATAEVLDAGVAAMVPGIRLTDVSHALETATRAAEKRHGISLGIVEGYGGHGIGRAMHEDPFLSNEGKPGRGPKMPVGGVLAIEPMLILGGETDTRILDDDWTVVSVDGAVAAHWEHTVAITDDGPRILTPRP